MKQACGLCRRYRHGCQYHPDDAFRLTAKQRRFVAEYLVDLNATQASIRAGYSRKTSTEIGYENLRKPHIQEAIQEAINEQAKRTNITADRVVYELARIAFANMGEYISVQKDGSAIVDLTGLSADQGAAIQEIISDIYVEGSGEDAELVKRVKLKLHARSKPLELLGKHVGLSFIEKHEHSGPDGGPIKTEQTIDVSTLSLETLERIMKETASPDNDE